MIENSPFMLYKNLTKTSRLKSIIGLSIGFPKIKNNVKILLKIKVFIVNYLGGTDENTIQ